MSLASVPLFSLLTIVNAEVLAVYGPAKISTGGDEETLQIALDYRGNVHVIWSSDEGTYLCS